MRNGVFGMGWVGGWTKGEARRLLLRLAGSRWKSSVALETGPVSVNM